MSVVDREALKEARHAVDDKGSDFYVTVRWPWSPFVAAARSVLEGEAIWWCVTHGCSTKVKAGCREGWVQLGGRDYSCRLVSGVFVEIEEE